MKCCSTFNQKDLVTMCIFFSLISFREVTMIQLSWPDQDLQFITENIAWSHQDLPEALNTTIHGQGHAPGTRNVSIQQQFRDSTEYAEWIILFFLQKTYFWDVYFLLFSGDRKYRRSRSRSKEVINEKLISLTRNMLDIIFVVSVNLCQGEYVL